MSLTGRLRLALIALAALTGAALAQSSLTLDLPSAREFARQAILSGQPELARSVALGLLKADPNDAAALIVLAVADGQMGMPDKSLRSARLAFAAAKDPVLRHEAAFFAGQAAAAADRLTLAQYWLRRAASAAPTSQQYQASVAAFQQVAARNPWKTTLSVGMTPSSNINQGSSGTVLIINGMPTIFTLNGQARALSGVEGSVDLGTRYRFAQTATSTGEAGFRLQSRTYALTEEAQDQAPDAKGADFAYTSAEVSLRYYFVLAPDAGPFSIGVVAAQNWYGGDPYGQAGRLELGKAFRLGDTVSARIDALIEQRSAVDATATSSKVEPATVYSLQASLNKTLKSGAVIGFQLARTELISDVATAEFTAVTGEVRYALAKPIGPVMLSVAVSATSRDYPALFGGRQDERFGGSLDFAFPKAEVWGFAPTLSISTGHTRSNISRFETDYLGAEIGIRSVF